MLSWTGGHWLHARLNLQVYKYMHADTVYGCAQLYDAVEASCQDVIKNKPEAKEQAAAAHLLEELRLRFSRLV